MDNINVIYTLVDEIIESVDADQPSLEELERLLEDSSDLMDGPYYKKQPINNQDLLRDAKRYLEQKIAKLRNSQTSETKKSYEEDEQESDLYDEATEPSAHNPKAEEWMNKAETAFYAGKYQQSVGFYENVLAIEPTWERARQHKEQALHYLQTGYIPSCKLPSEAAILFGKAQSAARVLAFQRAKVYLEDAKQILAEKNIPRWQEGQELEEELDRTEEAKRAYEEGLEEFDQGNIDEAISRIQAAADLAGIPSYTEKARELREVRTTIAEIHQKLYARPITHELVLEASTKLRSLQRRYGPNPLFNHLHELIKSQEWRTKLLKITESHSEEAIEFQKPRTKNQLSSVYETIEGLLLEDPLNRELRLHFEWHRLQKQLDERQTLFRDERMTTVYKLRQQSQFWFLASIFTAILFLVVVLILIWLSFDKKNPWSMVTSLVSLVPIFASKLVYSQALQANDRADKLYGKIYKDNQNDLEMERHLFDNLRDKLFNETKKKGF